MIGRLSTLKHKKITLQKEIERLRQDYQKSGKSLAQQENYLRTKIQKLNQLNKQVKEADVLRQQYNKVDKDTNMITTKIPIAQERVEKFELQHTIDEINVQFINKSGTVRELYDNIQKFQKDKKYNQLYYKLQFKNERGRPMWVTLKNTSFKAFVNRLINITTHEVEGSDRIDQEDDKLVVNQFVFYGANNERVNGTENKQLDKLMLNLIKMGYVITTSDENNKNCLQIAKQFVSENYEIFDICLDKNIQDTLFKILLIFYQNKESVDFEEEPYDRYNFSNQNRIIQITYTNEKTGNKETHAFTLKQPCCLISRGIETPLDQNFKKIPCIDSKQMKQIIHIVLNNQIDSQKQFIRTQHFKETRKIPVNEQLEEQITQDNEKNRIIGKDQELEDLLVFFDFETVNDILHKNFTKPYAAMFHIATDKSGVQLKNADLLKAIQENSLYTAFYYGDNCIEEMVLKILKQYSSKYFIHFVGFNNAKFDNFLLVNQLIKMDKLQSVSIVNNSIFGFKINGYESCLDLAKIYPAMKLQTLTDSFLTKFQKQGELIDHTIIQQYYVEKQEIDTLFDLQQGFKFEISSPYYNINTLINLPTQTKSDQLIKYGIYDVICLMEILFKTKVIDYDLTQKLKNITTIEFSDQLQIFDMNKTKTLGSYSYAVWEFYLKHQVVTKENCQTLEILDSGHKLTQKDGKKLPGKTLTTLYEKLTESYNIVDVQEIHEIMENGQEKIIKNKMFNGITQEEYLNIRKYLFAGRTQVYWKQNQIYSKTVLPEIYQNEVKCSHKVLKIGGQMCLIDVVSLYPSSMLLNKYPIGKIIREQDFETTLKNKQMGFYWVTFDQLDLGKNILPKRNEDGLLDWNYQEQQRMYLNTVDILCLMNNGCNVQIENQGSICWEFSIDGKLLFGQLDLAIQQKQLQDYYKDSHKKEYNPALRTFYKLFCNSLSGKVIEQIHLEKYKYVYSQDKILKLIDEKEGHICHIDQKGVLIKYKEKFESEYKKQLKPLFLGVFIYAYSRKFMYENVIRDYNILYQDTDSALLLIDDYKKIRQEKPQLFKLETKIDQDGNEYQQKQLYTFDTEIVCESAILMAPKNYILYNASEKFQMNQDYVILAKKEIKNKFRFKGIKLNDRILIDEKENALDYQLFDMNEKQQISDKDGKLNDNVLEKIANSLWFDGYIDVIQGRFKRVIKERQADMENNIDNYRLQYEYITKRITI